MLGPDGLLPPGRHHWTLEKVGDVFVTAFPDSPTRGRIYARWLEHRQAVEVVIPIVRQLVDGSFVTSERAPRDIDVVTVVDGEAYDLLTDAEKLLLGPLFNGHTTRDVWMVDSFMVPEYPEGHADRAANRRLEGWWVNLWGSVKGGTSTSSKGFVVVES